MDREYLSTEEVESLLLLIRDHESVLVGGQAVAFWAGFYGIERLSADITRDIDFIQDLLLNQQGKDAFKFVERLARFSAHDASRYAHYQFGIDTLNAIPVEDFPSSSEFVTTRFPQIKALVEDKRRKFSAMMSRRIEQFDQGVGGMRFR